MQKKRESLGLGIVNVFSKKINRFKFFFLSNIKIETYWIYLSWPAKPIRIILQKKQKTNSVKSSTQLEKKKKNLSELESRNQTYNAIHIHYQIQ